MRNVQQAESLMSKEKCKYNFINYIFHNIIN